MKKLIPGGGVVIISSARILPADYLSLPVGFVLPQIGGAGGAPGYPFPHSSRPCELVFWGSGPPGKYCASLEWTDKNGVAWNYYYRVWDSYFKAQADVIYASGGDIDPDSRLMASEFFNYLLRPTLTDKEPAF